jgi:3-methylfumaryl-CoA hydratase
MWASTQLMFHLPIHIGERVRRVSTISAIDAKVGRTGPLVFVTTRMEFFGHRGLAVTEEQTSVFRGADRPATGRSESTAPVPTAVWERIFDPTPVLLFRYSALTMNTHRIHYDRRHATETEKYPGLVVHGSLQTLLLLDLVRHECPTRSITRCVVHARTPVFDITPLRVQGCPGADGTSATAWTLNNEGGLATLANMEFSN